MNRVYSLTNSYVFIKKGWGWGEGSLEATLVMGVPEFNSR